MTRTITVLALMGVLVLVGLNLYEYGKGQGVKSVKCVAPVKYVRATYSTEELQRMVTMRKRLERTK